MFIKHRFFLSTIAFFLHDSILSLHTNVSPHNSLHSLRMTAYLSPHGFISPSPHGFISPSPHGFIPPLHTDSFLLSTWIHFPSPHGFIPPLHTDSFLLSTRIHSSSPHDCILLSTQNILSFFGISNKHENGKYISIVIIVTVSTLHHSKQCYG